MSKVLQEFQPERGRNSSKRLLDLLLNEHEIVSFYKDTPVELCKSLRRIKLKVIGRGKQGIVFDTNILIDKLPVVIKQSPANLKKVCTEDTEFVKLCSQFVTETAMGVLLSQLPSPNFVKIFSVFICPKKGKGFQIMEKLDGDLTDLFRIVRIPEKNRELAIESVIFQISHALYLMQKEMGATHNDLKPDNIFIKKIPRSQKLIYKIGNVTYNIPNLGFIIKIGDLGQARAFGVKSKFTKFLQVKRQLIDEPKIQKVLKFLPKTDFIKRAIVAKQFRSDALFRPTIDLQFLMNNLLFLKDFQKAQIVDEYFKLVEDKLCRVKGLCQIDRQQFFNPKGLFEKAATTRFPTVSATITPLQFIKSSKILQNFVV